MVGRVCKCLCWARSAFGWISKCLTNSGAGARAINCDVSASIVILLYVVRNIADPNA